MEAEICFPSWAGKDKSEVMHFMQNHIFYLNDKYCSCGMFQLYGYPCCHAVAVNDYHRQNVKDFVHAYFKKVVYLKVYIHKIKHVTGMNDYEVSPLGLVNPPHVKTRVGRPKKMRRKDANDIREPQLSQERVWLTHVVNVWDKATTREAVQILLTQVSGKCSKSFCPHSFRCLYMFTFICVCFILFF